MATQRPGQFDSLLAAADLSAESNKFLMATVNASGQAAIAGAGEFVYGTIQEPAPSGQGVTLLVSGVTKVKAGAAVAAGAAVMSNANGKAITAISTNEVFGRALTAAAAEDDIIEVIITHAGIL